MEQEGEPRSASMPTSARPERTFSASLVGGVAGAMPQFARTMSSTGR